MTDVLTMMLVLSTPGVRRMANYGGFVNLLPVQYFLVSM